MTNINPLTRIPKSFLKLLRNKKLNHQSEPFCSFNNGVLYRPLLRDGQPGVADQLLSEGDLISLDLPKRRQIREIMFNNFLSIFHLKIEEEFSQEWLGELQSKIQSLVSLKFSSTLSRKELFRKIDEQLLGNEISSEPIQLVIENVKHKFKSLLSDGFSKEIVDKGSEGQAQQSTNFMEPWLQLVRGEIGKLFSENIVSERTGNLFLVGVNPYLDSGLVTAEYHTVAGMITEFGDKTIIGSTRVLFLLPMFDFKVTYRDVSLSDGLYSRTMGVKVQFNSRGTQETQNEPQVGSGNHQQTSDASVSKTIKLQLALAVISQTNYSESAKYGQKLDCQFLVLTDDGTPVNSLKEPLKLFLHGLETQMQSLFSESN
jgi:hypothetical protein